MTGTAVNSASSVVAKAVALIKSFIFIAPRKCWRTGLQTTHVIIAALFAGNCEIIGPRRPNYFNRPLLSCFNGFASSYPGEFTVSK
jgi:hypothetical protein